MQTMTTRATLNIGEAAELIGVSRNHAYEVARRDGQLAGVPVIKIGERRFVIPRQPLLEALGVTTTNESPDDASPDSR